MLHYRTILNKQSDNWVVMIHGAGGSIEVWYRQVVDFARHFNLLLVDLAGHGESGAIDMTEGFNFPQAAEQVMEVVNHLKIKTCHFMGLSLGSIVVRLIAQRYPERVTSMVMAGAVTKLGIRLQALIRIATTFKHILPYGIVKRILAEFIIPQEKYRGSRNLFLNCAEKVSYDSFVSWIKLGTGIAERIKNLFQEQVSIPTLYVMGEDDALFLRHVRNTVSRSKGNHVSLAIVPDAGHVCNVDNKTCFNQLTIDFIRQVDTCVA